MDGVLADVESSWVYVHSHFGVNNDSSLFAYLRGEIDDLEFIRRDIGLWKAKDPSVTSNMIRDVLKGVPIMPGAKEAVEGLRERGVKTAIVSAGIDLLSERIADDLRIDRQVANGLVADRRGRLSGEGKLRVRLMDKGDAVLEVMDAFGVSKEETVAVGNSQYDVSMFTKVGKGIAFMPADETVREGADDVVDEKDLAQILRVI